MYYMHCICKLVLCLKNNFFVKSRSVFYINIMQSEERIFSNVSLESHFNNSDFVAAVVENNTPIYRS